MELASLFKHISGYWTSRALLTAVELDLFTHIQRGCTTFDILAETAQVSRRGLDALLPVLIKLDLVLEGPDGYELTPSGKFLSMANPHHRLGVFWHHLNLWKKWNQLTDSVVRGTPVQGELDLESFLLAMSHGKTETYEKYFNGLDLHNVTLVLDLGGGPGSFSLAFLEALPDAAVVLFDLPEVIELARKLIPGEVLQSGRLTLRSGDFRRDPFGKKYDLVWASSMIHSYGEEDVRLLMRKSRKALVPGGRLVIRDFFVAPEKQGALFPALFSLNMLVNTSDGKAYKAIEIRNFLEEEGYRDIQLLPSVSETDMIIGVRS